VKRALIAFLLLLGLAAIVVLQRHRILVYILAMQGPPALLERADQGPGASWYDDYFIVEELDSDTFAIGEPRYYQQNFNYLIVGSERAVLFDAGPGVRDIRPVAESLTDLPITFVPSHFHYDHVGNEITFEHVAVVDFPYLRARAADGRLRLTFDEHLGAAEWIEAPTLKVDEWLAPGSILDLGDRRLQVLHTPGHTQESISLLDLGSGYLFSGDFIIPGPLFTFLPNSSMGDYLDGARTVLDLAPPEARILCAHRVAPPGVPEVNVEDIQDLRQTLLAVRSGMLEGEGLYPVVYPVNDRVELWAEPSWLQDWRTMRERQGGD